MNHQEATKHAQSFFKSYPTAKAFHITTDGQVFAEKHHADSHAKSLIKDQKTEPVVHTVERGSAVEPVKEPAKVPEKTQEEKDKEAAEKKAASVAKGAATKAKNAAAAKGKE